MNSNSKLTLTVKGRVGAFFAMVRYLSIIHISEHRVIF